MKRGKRLQARNPERRPADVEAEVRERVFTRDRWRCRLEGVGAGPCSGPLTPHHRRKAGSGGAYVEPNLVALCAGHNTWVEDEPDRARLLFPHLVVREGDPEWAQLGKRAQRYAS